MPRKYATRRRRAPARGRKFARRKNFGRTRKGYRRPATRARILSVSTTKKRDTMRLAQLGTDGSINPAPMRGVTINIPGNGFSSDIWCPTFRLMSNSSLETARMRRSVYWKGVSERYRIELNTNKPIELRRIVFQCPDRVLLSGTGQPAYLVETSTNRYWRTLGSGQMNTDYTDLLFAGQRNIDWLDPMTAKTDTKRVKIMSDRRIRVASNNDSETVKELRFYTGFNKNFSYDDDENGGNYNTSGWAEYSAFGDMQNVYVANFWYGVTSVGQAPLVTIDTTVYWHER